MGPQIELPGWLEGSLAGILIVMALALLVAFGRGIIRRQKTEAGVDDRSAKQIDMAMGIAADARSDASTARADRNRMQEELFRANQAYISMSQDLTQRHAGEIDKLRSEISTLSSRLDGCEQRHAEAEEREAAAVAARAEADAREQDCARRMDELRDWVLETLGKKPKPRSSARKKRSSAIPA
jgi:hypothetical protein